MAQLEDWEVGLIRAMLDRNSFTKQEIVAYFTRPERSINQGRISEIESDHERYQGIPAKTDEELDQFLKEWREISFPSAPNVDLGPVHPQTLTTLFPLRSGGDDQIAKLAVSETDVLEGKESFNWGHKEKYAKIVSAMGNNRGGYLLFGVKDGSFEVVGIQHDRMEKFDLRKASQYFSRIFNQSINVELGSFQVGNCTVGAFYVHVARSKPIICKVDDGILSSGAIYYRYPGETRQIQAPELEILLRERDSEAGGRLVEIAQRVQALGVENTAILDLSTGLVEGEKGRFVVDESLLPLLKFINQGEFDETEGAPTLKLVGDLQTLGVEAGEVGKKFKGNIAERDIIEDFIGQDEVSNPKAYIAQLCHVQPLYLPIYYYAARAGFNLSELTKFLGEVPSLYKRRIDKQIARVNEGRAAPAVGRRVGLETQIEEITGDEPIIVDDEETAKLFLKALRVLTPSDVSLDRVLSVLGIIFIRFGNQEKLRSYIRYAVSDVDLKWFRPKVTAND